MSQFVLVANGISSEHFEKAMEIKIRSGVRVSFIPQPSQQLGVNTQSMSSVKANPAAPEILNSIRFEWDHAGEEFGAEIVRALAGHHQQHAQQHEPAA
jgi:hypothetical protein